MTSVLVVSDTHEDMNALERLLAQAGKHDRTVFLGDHFDSFHRTPQTTLATLGWLLKNHDREDYEFLWGNHDLPYAFPHILDLMCSGYSESTQALINEHQEIWRRFKLFTEVDGWLLTHAGVRPDLPWAQNIEHHADECMESLAAGEPHPMVRAGRGRGGMQKWGGVTWLDWDREFAPVDGLKQLVGHSVGWRPRYAGPLQDNVCIDTELQHYAIIEDGTLTVHEVTRDDQIDWKAAARIASPKIKLDKHSADVAD